MEISVLMKLANTRAIATIFVLGASTLGLWYWIHGDHCDKAVAQTLQSPDGKWIATATQEECGGATGGIYYLVQLKGDGGDVTVLDIAPIDSNAFHLKWNDLKNLEIVYPGSTSTYTKLDSYDGIKFSYVDTHSARNKPR